MCPMANAMVRTVSPNARATPRNPMPNDGKAAARTALPHPPNTSQNVPKNSATALFPKGIVTSFAPAPRRRVESRDNAAGLRHLGYAGMIQPSKGGCHGNLSLYAQG